MSVQGYFASQNTREDLSEEVIFEQRVSHPVIWRKSFLGREKDTGKNQRQESAEYVCPKNNKEPEVSARLENPSPIPNFSYFNSQMPFGCPVKGHFLKQLFWPHSLNRIHCSKHSLILVLFLHSLKHLVHEENCLTDVLSTRLPGSHLTSCYPVLWSFSLDQNRRDVAIPRSLVDHLLSPPWWLKHTIFKHGSI